MGLLAGGGGGIEHPLSCDASGTLDDQLISYWKMDESSWTNDCSTDSAMDAASSNHADSCPAGGGMTTPVAGKFSNAASFDGVDDFLNARSAAALDNLGTAGMTLSAWINPEPLGAQSYLLMAKSTSDTPAQGWKWVITPVRRMEFHVDFGTTSSDSLFRTSSTTVTTGAWNHIAVTWTGSNDLNMMKMYINGTEVAYINGRNGCNDGTPVPCNFVSDAIHDLRIGSAPTMSVSARYYGKMDDARVYSRVLTAGEISSLYNGGTGCIPS
jgi:hypothetical protein